MPAGLQISSKISFLTDSCSALAEHSERRDGDTGSEGSSSFMASWPGVTMQKVLLPESCWALQRPERLFWAEESSEPSCGVCLNTHQPLTDSTNRVKHQIPAVSTGWDPLESQSREKRG